MRQPCMYITLPAQAEQAWMSLWMVTSAFWTFRCLEQLLWMPSNKVKPCNVLEDE